jgi:hypothetical protein
MQLVAVLFFGIGPGRKVCKKTGLAHRALHQTQVRDVADT